MTAPVAIARATLTPVTDAEGRSAEGLPSLTVQFNPETLEVAARSKLQEEKGEKQDKTPVQIVGGTERTLSVQLIFDQTMDGADVRNQTTKIVALMQAGDAVLEGYDARGGDKAVKVPQVALFEWGNFSFRGVIADCSETLEYFSADGVPLRATVKFSMQERNATFAAETGDASSDPVDGGMDLPPDTPLPANAAVQDAAKKNGVENARLPEVDKIHTGTGANGDVGGSVRGALGNFSAQAGASAGGAGASAGLGFGAGGGGGGATFGLSAAPIATSSIGAGAGLGLGVGAGAGVGFDAGLGASLGGGASAGAGIGAGIDLGIEVDIDLSVEAGMSAFAGLTSGGGAGSGASLSGLGELKDLGNGLSAGSSASTGTDGDGIFTAKAEVGARINLAEFLFGEDR